jgi:cytochrome c55X
LLLTTVLDGRPGTAMPPWRPFMTEAEGRWVVDSLIRGDLVPKSTEMSQ